MSDRSHILDKPSSENEVKVTLPVSRSDLKKLNLSHQEKEISERASTLILNPYSASKSGIE
jgi:hypothetical protein